MRRNVLYLQTALLFLLLLVIFFGLFLVAIPLAPSFRDQAIAFIHSSDTFLITCGTLLIIVALLLLTAAYSTTKGVTFTVQMGEKSSYTIDEKVLNKLLKDYFKNIFNNFEVLGQFQDNQIHVILEMPPMPFIEQKPLLERIEKDLSELFEEQFDYSAPFSLSATVASEK